MLIVQAWAGKVITLGERPHLFKNKHVQAVA